MSDRNYLNLYLYCMDCGKRSERISEYGELLIRNPQDIQRILLRQNEGSLQKAFNHLLFDFVSTSTFLRKHSGHKIVIRNRANHVFIDGEWY